MAAETVKTKLIFVGYTTRRYEGPQAAAMIPRFEPHGSCKSEEARAKSVAEKTEDFLRKACDIPYVGTFASVALYDPALRANGSQVPPILFRAEGAGEPSVAARVRVWLLDRCPGAWSDSLHGQRGAPAAAIVGFNPSLFLKMLGLECSLPDAGCPPLPVSLWYNNTDHRDLEGAVLPPHCSLLDWSVALARRRPLDSEHEGFKFDAMTKGWDGPGRDARRDVLVGVYLATQLGFLEPAAVG